MKTEINYLGYKINSKGITCENSFKLSQCPRPKDVKTLQQFLGLANYFRRFVPSFSTLASPLYKLLRGNISFNWDEECEQAFLKLKNILNEATVLAHPDYTKDFILFTDASNIAIGACLAQANDDGELQPLSYFSKTLSKTQQNYSTTKKEALGLVSALKHYQYVLLGYHTTVCTDHRPLVSLFSKKLPSDTALARWCLAIQSFQLTIKYYPGKFNCVADYMSRLENPPKLSVIQLCKDIAHSEGTEPFENDDINSFEESTTLLADDEKPLANYIPSLDDVSWSNEELIQAQNSDDFCITIKEQFNCKVTDGKNKNIGKTGLEQYLYLGGVLYKRRKIDNNHLSTLNIVVPTSLLNKAIKSVHYITHGDAQHTLFKFRFRYFHQYEVRYIKKYLETCDLCKILKGPTPKPIILKQAPIPSKPFDQVSMDILYRPVASND